MKYQEKESAVLEFKREIPSNQQIVKTVIGFCNMFGGKLIQVHCQDRQTQAY